MCLSPYIVDDDFAAIPMVSLFSAACHLQFIFHELPHRRNLLPLSVALLLSLYMAGRILYDDDNDVFAIFCCATLL